MVSNTENHSESLPCFPQFYFPQKLSFVKGPTPRGGSSLLNGNRPITMMQTRGKHVMPSIAQTQGLLHFIHLHQCLKKTKKRYDCKREGDRGGEKRTLEDV